MFGINSKLTVALDMRWLTFPNVVISLFALLALFVFVLGGVEPASEQGQNVNWSPSIVAVHAQILAFLGSASILLSIALNFLDGHRGESKFAAVVGTLTLFAAALAFLQPLNGVVALLVLGISLLLIIALIFLLIESRWWRVLIILSILLLLNDTRAVLLLLAVFPLETVQLVRWGMAVVVVVGMAIWIIFRAIIDGGAFQLNQAGNRRDRRDRRKRRPR